MSEPTTATCICCLKTFPLTGVPSVRVCGPCRDAWWFFQRRVAEVERSRPWPPQPDMFPELSDRAAIKVLVGAVEDLRGEIARLKEAAER